MKKRSKIPGASPLWLAVFLAGIGTARAQPYAYVTNRDNRALSVIDTSTDTVVDRVPNVGDGDIVLNPDGTSAFITDRASNTIAIIDVATRQVVDRLPVGAYPWELAVTPEGDRAYLVRLRVAEPLVFLDVSERVVTTSALRRMVGDFDKIAIGPGRRGYVIDGHIQLQVFDLDADVRVDVLQADELFADMVEFDAIALTADGAFLWAVDTYFSSLNKINLRRHVAELSIPFRSSVRELVLNSNGTRVYMWDSELVVFDTDTRAFTRVFVGGNPRRMALTADGALAFITLLSGDIAVVDTASLTVVDFFPVEPGIWAIAIAP
jgi:YVTN family beta-propeller protein